MISDTERAALQRRIATNLTRARTQASLTKADVARELGVHWNYLHSWENGKTLPSALYIVMLAELLGVSTDYLLGVTDHNAPTIEEQAEAAALDAHRDA